MGEGATVFNIILIAVGILVLGAVMWWYLRSGDKDRYAEDDARAFFEEHGRWPDESPRDAQAALVRGAAPAVPMPVSRPGDDGRV